MELLDEENDAQNLLGKDPSLQQNFYPAKQTDTTFFYRFIIVALLSSNGLLLLIFIFPSFFTSSPISNSSQRISNGSNISEEDDNCPYFSQTSDFVSVDGIIPWFHVEKTGSNFINVLVHSLCDVPKNFTCDSDCITGFREKHHFKCRFGIKNRPMLWDFRQRRDNYHTTLHPKVWNKYSPNLVTMLRDPSKRALSAYQHKIWNSKDQDKINRTFEYDMNHLKGFTTTTLIGRQPWLSLYYHREQLTLGIHELALAKRRLRVGFQFVGILDRLEESVCLFHAMFNSRRCVTSEFSFIKHEEDKPKGDRELDASMKQFVEDYVDEIDEELFIYANELLDEKMMQYGLTKEKCKLCGCAT